jgi:hypothetical protein
MYIPLIPTEANFEHGCIQQHGLLVVHGVFHVFGILGKGIVPVNESSGRRIIVICDAFHVQVLLGDFNEGIGMR